MEKVYRAVDGKIFNTEEECRAYEGEGQYKLWDRFGEHTATFEEAYVIYIPNTLSLHKFYFDYPEATYDIGAIGCWYWDDDWECYAQFGDLEAKYNFVMNILRQEDYV